MFWPFTRKKQPRDKAWVTQRIRFVGEQDGDNERLLKSALIEILQQRPHVERAYLARAVFDNSQSYDVVLAILSTSEADDELNRQLGNKFQQWAARDVHLDIMFLSSEQNTEVSAVCSPFYQRA